MNSEKKHHGSLLVVDDTAENLRLLANMLGEKGYEVRPVTNGRHALQAAERSAPDLILLDINMPEMDGYEVCRRLKEHTALRDIPVIFLTALTDTADKLKAFTVGGVDYISKPFQIDEVLARVKVHIALRRAQKELAENFDRLRELERARDDLVHMIIHDMRSPLMVIMGNLDLVRMCSETSLSPDASDRLNRASQGVRSLTDMTNDLLDVRKMEEGKMAIKLESCDLVALAREVATGITAMDQKRSITVDQEASVSAPFDKEIIRRILQNLLSNAVKHTPAGSAVRVTAIETGDHVRVSVIDKGSGVPLESRGKIFEKFGATETRNDRKYHSVGLGLAFCKLAVDAHGGRIGVDENPGGGSIFWFELMQETPKPR